MRKLFVDMLGKLYDYPGNCAIHEITTPVIQVQPDMKTAKGMWYHVGFNTFDDPEKGVVPIWQVIKYNHVFVKEDGQWKWLEYGAHLLIRSSYERAWVDEPVIMASQIQGAEPTDAPVPDEPTSFHEPYRRQDGSTTVACRCRPSTSTSTSIERREAPWHSRHHRSISRLCSDGRVVYFDGELIPDVTKHPVLKITNDWVAMDYVLTNDPRYQDLLTDLDEDGDRVAFALQPQRTREDLLRLREIVKLWARVSFGKPPGAKFVAKDGLNAVTVVAPRVDASTARSTRPTSRPTASTCRRTTWPSPWGSPTSRATGACAPRSRSSTRTSTCASSRSVRTASSSAAPRRTSARRRPATRSSSRRAGP